MTIREAIKFEDGRELDIKYPINLKDENGGEVYFEDSDGHKSGTPKPEAENCQCCGSKLKGKS